MLEKLFDDLYDVFGYLLPGIPGLLALLVLFWTFTPANITTRGCTPVTVTAAGSAPVTITTVGSTQVTITAGVLQQSVALWVWICAGIAAYFIGHVFAGLAQRLYGDYWETWQSKLDFPGHTRRCWVMRFLNWPGWDPSRFEQSDEVMRRLYERAQAIAAAPHGLGPVSPNWVLHFCGVEVFKAKATGHLELYGYREAFYTGTSVSILFFALALVVSMIKGLLACLIWGQHPVIPLFFTLIVFVTSVFLAVPSLIVRAHRIRGKRFVDLVVLFSALNPAPS
jgi:hypothetical protein